jgi:O-methyltransferase
LPPHTTPPDPDGLLQLRDGIYAADLVVAAVAWFDFFTWLDANRSDIEGICEGLAIAERPADVLCTLLAAMGLIERQGPLLATTSLARRYLVEGAPSDLRPYYSSLKERPACRELAAVLRTDEPAAWSSAPCGTDWSAALADPEFAASLTDAMDSRGTVLAPVLAGCLDLSGAGRLLDIAGGSGVYACALVERFPTLEATVLERPPVDDAARLLLARRGYGRRVGVVTGDLFAELPGGYDVHLFSHVLHDWGEQDVRKALERSFDALPPGGLLVDHDTHINWEKTGPLAVAQYSVLLMHSTRGKCWSFTELLDLLTDVGFEAVAVSAVAADRTIVTARRPG